ncbi:MAG: cobyrinate a,c-diamide synthase [bacterium]
MPSGIVLAGLQSSSGKTALTCLLLAGLQKRGVPVQPFKAGPDYLDPAYHQHFASCPSINLDSWMMGRSEVVRLVQKYGTGKLGLLEGVMGLFDGASPVSDEGSTLELSRWLNWPIVLVVPAAKAGRSVRAAIRGFQLEAGADRIRGLILNQVSGESHADYLKQALADLKIPILGALPRLPELQWPERHLGLQAVSETSLLDRAFLGRLAEQYLNLDQFLSLAPQPEQYSVSKVIVIPVRPSCRIGVAQDSAFHFHYHENLEWLRQQGAELVQFSPLEDSTLPPALDGILLSGGFPECFAEKLSANQSMLKELKEFIEAGGSCYAECGGLMLLADSLRLLNGDQYPMAGVIPGTVSMTSKLQHFGYSEATPTNHRESWRGHEFHHSKWEQESSQANAWTVTKRNRVGSRLEGYRYRNLHASYIHLYFPKAAPLLSELFFKKEHV